MTVETPQTEVQTTEQTYGLVRGTTQLVSGFYGRVKANPYLKTSFETVESRIPNEWIERVTAVSEPMIEGIDTRLDTKIRQIDNATSPVRKMCLSDVKGAVVAVPTKVIAATAAVPTKVIAATGEKVGQWKSMRGDLSKKAVVRIEKGLAVAREFSATKGKDMIHFDLIKYSEEVLDNASAVAKPLYEPVQKNLAAAVVKVNAAMVLLQEAATARREELTQRLHVAIAAARELSNHSVTFVQTKYSTISSKIPNSAATTAALVGKLPARASPALDYAVEFILASPQLFLDVKSKADLNLSNGLKANVDNLLAAIKEVLVTNKPAAAPTATTTEEKVASDEEVEEKAE